MKELTKSEAVEGLYEQRMGLARLLRIKLEEEEELHGALRVNGELIFSFTKEEPPPARLMPVRNPAERN